MTVVFHVSGHGFGHAARVIEVINAFRLRRPDATIIVRTAAARWLFDLTVHGAVRVDTVECDVGVVQRDSLTPDLEATGERARRFYERFDERVREEARALQAIGAHLVVADLPPLALAAAHEAGIPAIALGNFTWDWIYEDYAPWMPAASWIVPLIRGTHRHAEEAWRLPMHGGFAGFRRVVDLPLVARHSRRTRAEVRARLGSAADRRVVLVSFGGFGLDALGDHTVAGLDHVDVVVTEGSLATGGDRTPGPAVTRRGHVVSVNEHGWYAEGWRYEDLVRGADIVITKPGYGIIAECVANGASMIYTSRGRFAEYDVLVAALPESLPAVFISNEDLLAGRWRHAIEAVSALPPVAWPPPTDGADFAADRLLTFLP